MRGLKWLMLGVCAVILSGCSSNSNPAAPAPANPNKPKNIGGTIQGAPSGGKFTVTGRYGTFNVDATKAKITRDGNPIEFKELKADAFITVNGPADGSNIKATAIRLIHDKGQLPDKPTAVGAN